MKNTHWLVMAKSLHHPYSIVTKKVQAETAQEAFEKVNGEGRDYTAVSARVDYGIHLLDQRAASL